VIVTVCLSNEITEMLEALVLGVQQCLAGNLVAVYLRGSLASGGFVPETSDVDVLIVTDHPVDAAEFDALAALHRQLSALDNPFAHRIEAAYVDRAAVRRFQAGLCHPTLGQGEALAWSEHHANWILERWTVREHGIVLLGPDPKTLIDAVSPAELHGAVRDRLVDWAEWARTPDDPDWLLPRSHKAYVVETMCRALYTLEHGSLTSKEQSVSWAIGALSEPWRSTVMRSRLWRTDDTVDPDIVPQVRRFVLWVALRYEG
jgi:aminoglycoside adenylyltransferase-like protein/nucleotidyltransferase-like protein